MGSHKEDKTMAYTLIVRIRTNPALPGLRIDTTFENGVRMIESLEGIAELVFELVERR
jgi:hypothetical protein